MSPRQHPNRSRPLARLALPRFAVADRPVAPPALGGRGPAAPRRRGDRAPDRHDPRRSAPGPVVRGDGLPRRAGHRDPGCRRDVRPDRRPLGGAPDPQRGAGGTRRVGSGPEPGQRRDRLAVRRGRCPRRRGHPCAGAARGRRRGPAPRGAGRPARPARRGRTAGRDPGAVGSGRIRGRRAGLPGRRRAVRTAQRHSPPTRSSPSSIPPEPSSGCRRRCSAAARRSGCSRSAVPGRGASTRTRSRPSRPSPTRPPSPSSTLAWRTGSASSPWWRSASGSPASCTTGSRRCWAT